MSVIQKNLEQCVQVEILALCDLKGLSKKKKKGHLKGEVKYVLCHVAYSYL